MGEVSNDFINEGAIDSEFEIESHDDMMSQNEIESSFLFSEKKFGHITRENGVLHQRTYLCNHEGFYELNTKKNTVTKKTQYPYLVNTSCSKINNIEHSIFINKIGDTYNHLLNPSRIMFEDGKQFIAEMLANVKFMTKNCKFGATTNYYGMALSLLVEFNSNRKNILLVQVLLCDKSVSSYKWAFTEIIKATNVYLAVILTEANPAVDAMVRQAYCFTWFKFTKGIIATSQVELVNACLNHLLHSSNVFLYGLLTEITRLLDI
ncbi:6149_t:CDS:2 [Cetraspora pellucida]|uniref:6149_t:CDS:1 n=1 Tax=Cetraspora pellucida TaxID=1433469 RepID=A0A9N9NRN4_9GLOM|nr:6149_t:CDS:2 [Cetraspora pellucida]